MEIFNKLMGPGCRFTCGVLLIILFLSCPFFAAVARGASEDITHTKHNLSVSGPGNFRALTETRICVFCHTPHNATPNSPLWNKEIQAQTYSLYTSPTLRASPLLQPTGPTKLCLSCHDGTIALGEVANPAGGIVMQGAAQISGGTSYFGLDLSTHHPVSFPYGAANPQNNPELVPVSALPATLLLGGDNAEIHCNTCHNPHDDTFGNFLVMDNRYSALCTSCHQMSGWDISSHSTLVQGCEVCHIPHFAVDIPLLRYSSSDYCLSCHGPVPAPPAPPPVIHGELGTASATVKVATANATAGTEDINCISCHSQEPAPHASPPPVHGEFMMASATSGVVPGTATGRKTDISGQVRKLSGHHVQSGIAAMASRGRRGRLGIPVRGVTCSDCHNPHAVNKRKATSASVSGMIQKVSGVDRNGMKVSEATSEYEICLKCHGDYTSDIKYIARVVNTTNKRTSFDTSNPSYHPVIGMGRNFAVPSIPSSLEPGMSVSSVILCTDCHGDDTGGSKGPHGSSYPPILRERYEMTDGTPESYQNYALCYRCHNRTSILNDVSFQKKIARTTKTGGGHSGHLQMGATCSCCHDPHGVTFARGTETGDHTNLINFDLKIVAPNPGRKNPLFVQKGTFSGSCTLRCHSRSHTNESYP